MGDRRKIRAGVDARDVHDGYHDLVAVLGWRPGAVRVRERDPLCALCMVPGPVRAMFSWSALRALGLISYGVYLFHWPVFLVLSPQRTGLGQVPLFALQVAVTLVIALLSYVFIERPIRERRGAVLVAAPRDPARSGGSRRARRDLGRVRSRSTASPSRRCARCRASHRNRRPRRRLRVRK